MYVTPGEAAEYYKVCRETIRLWSNQGTIPFSKTKGGQRRYWIEPKVKKTIVVKKKNINQDKIKDTVVYARVSSIKQQNLEKQIQALENYCQEKKYDYSVITDIASGINFKRKGLQTILEAVLQGTIKKIVVAHNDRLARVGLDLVKWFLTCKGAQIEVVFNESNDGKEELSEDIISIITHYTAKFNGSKRYHDNRPKDSVRRNPVRHEIVSAEEGEMPEIENQD